jgi:hypothetical protein
MSSFFYCSIVDVRTESQTGEDANVYNIVVDFSPTQPLVLQPWLLIPESSGVLQER